MDKDIEKYYVEQNRTGESKEYASPSGKYKLTVSKYKTKEGCWDYSRGIITDQTGKTIADVKRNYSSFWHNWALHPNGNEYLLCGEDYQGQTVVNCTQGTLVSYLPEAAKKGFGFCWVQALISPEGTKLAVFGCNWGGPFEVILCDFQEPEKLPYKEYFCADETFYDGIEKWQDDHTLLMVKEEEVRKSDGKRWSDLTSEEEDAANPNDFKTVKELRSLDISVFKEMPPKEDLL